MTEQKVRFYRSCVRRPRRKGENMDDQRMNTINQEQEAVDVQDRKAASEERQEMQKNHKRHEKRPRISKKRAKGGTVFLHFLQHVSLVVAVVMIAMVVAGSYVAVDTRNGKKVYSLSGEDRNSSFEDSDLFNSLLGNSISDIICYGVIRGQMETDGRYDPGKEIDVTAFANRYNGVTPEYITARYYLDDLIKWSQAGFEGEEVYMSGSEVDRFLSRTRIVTQVDLKDYTGGAVSYLNSDLSSSTRVVDVSGNILDSEDIGREDASASILKNRYHTVDGKNIEDHVFSWDEYYALCDNVRTAATDLAINYEEYLKYRNYYDSGSSNIVYFITRTIGEDTQVFTNMDVKASTAAGLKKEFEEKSNCRKYLFYDARNAKFETNTRIEESTLRYILNGFDYAYPEDTQVMIGVADAYPVRDCFYQARESFGNYMPYLWQYVAVGGFCVLIYLFLLIALTMKEGQVRRKETGEAMVYLNSEDYIPTEVMILAAAAVFSGLFYGTSQIVNTFWQSMDNVFMIIVAGVVSLIISLMFSFFYYSFVRRIKARILWRGSLLRRFSRFLKKTVLYGYDHSNIILRTWVPFGIFVVLNLGGTFLLAAVHENRREGLFTVGLLVLVLLDGAVGYMLYRSSLAKQKILDGIRLIREGNLSHKVSEEGMYGDDLELARAVNSIGESVRTAVETSMKDERLKADLITNVSHDIKTPLTSIINYVDLLKRQNVKEPKVTEYIQVLDAKSQRLKQLTDDLVEASKISSGNIILQWEKINLVELLNQTIGEFSEKFEEKALYPVFRAPKVSVYIEADSRRIWRVIENLFNNIFKYALEGTRVYIDLEFTEQEEVKLVVLSVKNISAQPLKVSPEELTERFIRGDESRTTEGSGLGLSIAKNLTEVQRGKFEIIMDGDLFKVNLTFPLLEESNTL